jgi:hypothetical protein
MTATVFDREPPVRRGSRGYPPTVAAIERQIVRRLAEHAGRDPEELDMELRLADRDLPVEASELRPILGAIERDFEVALPRDRSVQARLSYVRELALLIQERMSVPSRSG